MNDHTRTLINALNAGAAMDKEYKRKVSGIILALEQGILSVPFGSHTNGNYWQLWNRAEKAQVTFCLQDGEILPSMILA